MLLYRATVIAFALSPVVNARRGSGSSGGGGGTTVDNSNFLAPPLQIANLVAYGVLLLATLIQLASAVPAPFRAAARLPAIGTVIALIILTVGYALGVALVVTHYTVDDTGFPRISALQYLNLEIAQALFFRWGDPAIFAAVALVLYNRYRTAQTSLSAALIGFASVAFVLFVVVVVLAAVQWGMIGAAVTAVFHAAISTAEMNDRINSAYNVFYAYIAFHIVATLFLVMAAFLVKARTKKDKITSLTLFVIMPLLVLHAITRLVFAILQARLEAADALDFSSTLALGVLHLAVMTILVFLVVRPRLWSAMPLTVQGAPPAQFPGQWGYPQQLQGVYPVQPETPGTQVQMQRPQLLETDEKM